jgi:hypothetical protein
MTDERPLLLLRPVHSWFQLWEDVIPSVYRVAAVAGAAAVSAAVLVLVLPVHGLVAALLATVLWILLAIVQEHDERVLLEPDLAFLAAMRAQVEPVLERAGFVFRNASGPQRSRPGRQDTFFYEAPGAQAVECVDIWIHRGRSVGAQMDVTVDGAELSRLLVSRDEPQLAQRVSRTEAAGSDAAALAVAFEVVLPEN